MKPKDVAIGGLYAVKVSGKIAPVVIDEEHPNGGWVGTNQETNRQVRIKTAQRLCCPWDDYLKGGEDESEREAPTANTGSSSEAPRAKEGAPGEDTAEASSKGTKAEKKRTRAKPPARRSGAMEPREGGTGDEGEKKLSGLDAAAKVLSEADEPLNAKAIVERAFEAGYWQSGGKTPWARTYSAVLREIQNKGDESRFRKVERGKFALAK